MADVPSPCTRICRIDDASGHCTGCLRTLDEIVAWPSLSDAHKRIVLAALVNRSAPQGPHDRAERAP